jgi:hypothetical protein
MTYFHQTDVGHREALRLVKRERIVEHARPEYGVRHPAGHEILDLSYGVQLSSTDVEDCTRGFA